MIDSFKTLMISINLTIRVEAMCQLVSNHLETLLDINESDQQTTKLDRDLSVQTGRTVDKTSDCFLLSMTSPRSETNRHAYRLFKNIDRHSTNMN